MLSLRASLERTMTHTNRPYLTGLPTAMLRAFVAVAGTLTSFGGSGSLTARAAEPPAEQAEEARPAAAAAEKADRPSLTALLKLRLPLQTGDEAGVKLAVARLRDRLLAEAKKAGDGRRPTIVLEFAPPVEGRGAGSQFETALALARFLSSREMTDVRTVAWLPRSVHGHGVLAALACEEIVMAADAEIGDAAADEPGRGAASPTVVAAYREIAEARRTVPQAIAESMIDPAVEVVQLDSDEGPRILLRREVAEFRREHDVLNEQVLVPVGSIGRFAGRDGRAIGFVKFLAADRPALARVLEVPETALEEDQALIAEWKPVMLEVRGEITRATVSQFSTLLADNLSHRVNWIGVRIDSVGGDLSACVDLADKLGALNRNEVRTVAYVPVEARGGAALVALACDELVMHPDAKLGVTPASEAIRPPAGNRQLPPPQRNDIPPWQRPRPEPVNKEAEIAAAVAAVRDVLGDKTERSWSLLAAMIDPGVELLSYRNNVTGEERLMSAAEVAPRPDGANWVRGAPILPPGTPFVLAGDRAAQLGVASPTVDSFDQLRQRFGIQGEVPVVEPSWALKLVEVLRSPSLTFFLLVLGFIGVYVELKTPGVGVGAVVAVASFALFFWSRYLDQTAGALEVVLFLAGLALLLIEVFVVPGFGVFGLAGGLMVVVSLVLASQTFVIPKTDAELTELRGSMTMVAAAAFGVIALAFALRNALPKAPIFNKMVLEPPPPEERITLASREALADYGFLVGAEGEAATDLRPAGKALVDDRLIDVIAEGMPIDRGTPIVVVAAHATRVVVRAV